MDIVLIALVAGCITLVILLAVVYTTATNAAAQHHRQAGETQQQLQDSTDKLQLFQAAETTLRIQLSQLQRDVEHALRQRDEYRANIAALQEKYDKVSQHNAELQSDIQSNNVYLTAERDKLTALQQQFEQQKQQLKTEFKVISEQILSERQRALHADNQQGVGALLKPLQQQITGFQERINSIHSTTVRENSELKSEIKKVMDVGLKMSGDATNLTKVLKGDSQQRGAWGEAQLERTLEMSGLEVDAHFSKHTVFRDADNQRKVTDYLIKLPGNKHIIIDSKVSLLAYDRAIAATTDEARFAAMNTHVAAIKKHINDLASKEYTDIAGINSPDYVLMFLPIEPAYIEALKHDKHLFNYGYEKNIVLVSHTTLIPILRTIANLWVMEKSSAKAHEISDRAGDIYNAVARVVDRLALLGNTLNTVNKHYSDTVTSLAGQQGLIGKVKSFPQFSKRATKEIKKMPAIAAGDIVDKVHRLEAIALPDASEPQQQ